MIAPEHAAVGTELEIEILGTRHRATVLPESPFDSANARLRA
jgi:dimethylglycine dehydrogenase